MDSIQEDIRWLGFDWGDNLFFASNMFDFFYECAVSLIRKGLAYVDEQTVEEIRAQRGNVNMPGQESPYRNRSVEENLARFQAMKNGEIPEGRAILRARIDMASSNMNMRDPVLYRIMFAEHHNTGSSWCIYPMYDFAHPLEDAYEHITHSLCTLEIENHRPLYDWVIENCPVPARPRQTEFARLNLTYTVMSKREALRLVQEGHVSGWDDRRMPTVSGMRRRGYTPAAIRNFCHTIGITKFNGFTDVALLEYSVREDLNANAPRRMAVLNPLKVTITTLPENAEEMAEVLNNPEKPEEGVRRLPITREVWIERDDFMLDPPKKYFRLAPGRTVRLRGGYCITCTDYKQDAEGTITEIFCEHIPGTIGSNPPEGIQCRAAIHWVSTKYAVDGEIRIYDRLFTEENPDAAEEGFLSVMNPSSLTVITNAKLEPSLAGANQNSAASSNVSATLWRTAGTMYRAVVLFSTARWLSRTPGQKNKNNLSSSPFMDNQLQFCTVEEAVEEIRQGRMYIIVTDDPGRENEADLIIAPEFASAGSHRLHGYPRQGLVCAPLSPERADALQLPLMTSVDRENMSTAFTVSVDAAHDITTGISTAKRSLTIRTLADPKATVNDFVQPGHTFPLRAVPGGVLRRAGHTEATIDLVRMAGLQPAGVCCEIMKEDGTMARIGDSGGFQKKHGLKACTVAQLIEYRQAKEKQIRLVETVNMPTNYGDFTCHLYQSQLDGALHLALVHGEISPDEPTLVRVHSECLTGDVFGSRRCDCGSQLHTAMRRIAQEGGVLLYLRQEGRGIGLAAKFKAYKLQEQGLDTVEANLKLGYPDDLRDYGISTQILHDLGANQLRLLTNNPRKMGGLEGFGIKITEQVPLIIPPNEQNSKYLATKKCKLGHIL